MKIFLSGPYSRRLELCEYQAKLSEMGHEVTSTWLAGPLQKLEDGSLLGKLEEEKVENGISTPEIYEYLAQRDLFDIARAEIFVLFTGGGKRNGHNVEFGFALGINKLIFIIGEPENAFHHLKRVRFCRNYNEFSSQEIG